MEGEAIISFPLIENTIEVLKGMPAMSSAPISYAIAGSLSYFESGLNYLQRKSYVPSLVISDDSPVWRHKVEILERQIDLLICLAYPSILSPEELKLFPKGCINLHAGLPKYRGRHPVPWMLIDGVEEIPVSIHYMDAEIDTGDIITHDTVLVERDDDYASTLSKISTVGNRLLYGAIQQIESGIVYRRKQHKELQRYRRKRTPKDSGIRFRAGSQDLHRFINALAAPMPNAFSKTSDGRVIKFVRSSIGKEPGCVLAKTTDNRYVISTEDGVILVETDTAVKVGDKFLGWDESSR